MMNQMMLLIFVVTGALGLGHLFPMLGAPVSAMILGVVVASFAVRAGMDSISHQVSKKALLWAIIMLGLGLDAKQAGAIPQSTWVFMVGTVLFGLCCTWIIARVFHISKPVSLLLAVGTSICGGSAIAAIAGVSKARNEETAQALSTIFLYNIVAAVLFPVVGHFLGMTEHLFGVWAGTAINDTSSVLAAAYSYGGDAGAIGIQVKMARTLMILPVSLFVALFLWRHGGAVGNWKHVLPIPAIGFGIALLVHAALPGVPQHIWGFATTAGHFLMVIALACIGMMSALPKIWREGRKALLVGGIAWICLATFSYLVLGK